jgi:hypothetical protein
VQSGCREPFATLKKRTTIDQLHLVFQSRSVETVEISLECSDDALQPLPIASVIFEILDEDAIARGSLFLLVQKTSAW